MTTALIIGHAPGREEGFDFFLEPMSIQFKVVRPYEREPLPPLGSYDAIISAGGPMGVYEMNKPDYSFLREENDYLLERCGGMAVPMRICLDLGHRNMAGTKEEQNHLAWIRRYGSRCDVIDCQQTDLSASHHWPFTEENNRKGIIRGDEVVAAIHASGAEEIMLAFELRTSAYHPQENAHLENLHTSVKYWRQWVQE